jgi:hypothetical protein
MISYCVKYGLKKCRNCYQDCESVIDEWNKYYSIYPDRHTTEHLMERFVRYNRRDYFPNKVHNYKGLFMPWLRDKDEKMFQRIQKLMVLM